MTCKACRDHRCHTKVEWRNHPLAGHGFTPETGWTHPEAERVSKEERAAVRRRILPVSARDVYRAMMEWRGTANASNGAPKHAPEAKA